MECSRGGRRVRTRDVESRREETRLTVHWNQAIKKSLRARPAPEASRRKRKERKEEMREGKEGEGRRQGEEVREEERTGKRGGTVCDDDNCAIFFGVVSSQRVNEASHSRVDV